MLLSIIVFILLLAILVLIHEFGHFIVAKWCGIRVDEFAFGFPPRVVGRQVGETMYALNAIPLGGYVKLHGDGAEHDDGDPRSFGRASLLARIAVIVAGVAMNVVLALAVLSVAFSVGFSSISQDLTQVPGSRVVSSQVIIGELLGGSAAAKAGIQAGDSVISLAGIPISTDTQLQAVSKRVQATTSRQAQLVYERSGVKHTTTVTESAVAPALGIGLEEEQVVRVPWYRAPGVAWKETGSIIALTWDALKQFAATLFVHGHLEQGVSGPVGIYQATAVAAHTGVIPTVFLLVALSLNLAIMNILPIPALDGGRLLFLVVEGLFRRKVIADRIENAINATGFALLMVLIAVLTVHDIIHL